MPTPDDVALATIHFHQDMVDAAHTLKTLGYWPGYFMREVSQVGGVEAVRSLLTKSDPSEGFATLWELRRLDLSVEAFVSLPWYESLFGYDERQTARRRLEAHRFDVDAFLATAEAPIWAARLSGR